MAASLLSLVRLHQRVTYLGRVRLGSIRNKNNWNNASEHLFGSYSHSGIPGFSFRLFCSWEKNSRNIFRNIFLFQNIPNKRALKCSFLEFQSYSKICQCYENLSKLFLNFNSEYCFFNTLNWDCKIQPEMFFQPSQNVLSNQYSVVLEESFRLVIS